MDSVSVISTSSSAPATPTVAPVVTKRRGGAAPAPILPMPVANADDSGDYSDYSDEGSWDDEEDDEIMAAQRAEFAALWGISLTDMVDQKEDREFFKLMSKIQVSNFFFRPC